MSSLVGDVRRPKKLPKQPPNAGEKLVVKNLTPDGRFDWYYTLLTAAERESQGWNADYRVIEIHIKNFRVSELEAALNIVPQPFRESSGIFLVVDLTPDFSAATDQALRFIRTVGIESDGFRKFIDKMAFTKNNPESGVVEVTIGKLLPLPQAREVMRDSLLSKLRVEFNGGVTGKEVLEFWDDVGALRDGVWAEAELGRWVAFKYAVKRRTKESAAQQSGWVLAGLKRVVWSGLVVAAAGVAWNYWREVVHGHFPSLQGPALSGRSKPLLGHPEINE